MTEPFEFDGIERTDDVSTPAADGRSLVVLDPDDPASTLRAVLGTSGAADGGLHLLLVHPVRTYEERRRARARAGVTAPYSLDQFEAETCRDVTRLGKEWLDRTRSAFQATGAVGRVRDYVPSTVAAGGYHRVYVPGEKRSLLGRLFGGGSLESRLERVLPADVSIVPVSEEDGVVPSVVVPDEPGDIVADPEVPVGDD